MTTRFTELVGCSIPIQQAGMGAGAPPELAAAVSNAGAFGMLGAARPGLSAATLTAMLDRVDALTNKPFGVNFILAGDYPPPHELLEIAAARARVVEVFFTDPGPDLVRRIHAAGALAAWQVGSVDEAAMAEDAGCDFISAQGIEAGGHVRGTTPMLELLAAVLKRVRIPVLAAGGIGTAAAVSRVLDAGAAGVRVGTRFAASDEAGLHPQYRAALIAASAADTVYTGAFEVGWRNAPMRVLRSCLDAAAAFSGDTVGEVAALDGSRVAIARYSPMVADRSATGAIAAMPHWAGFSVDAVTRELSAAEVVAELAAEL
jgi:nitronate monooxygenase